MTSPWAASVARARNSKTEAPGMISLRTDLIASGIGAGNALLVEPPTRISASVELHCGIRMSRQFLTAGHACVVAITTESGGFFASTLSNLKITCWNHADTTWSAYMARVDV